MSGEFTTGFPNYNDTTVSSERYIRHMAQPTQLHPAPFNAHGSKVCLFLYDLEIHSLH